MYALIVRGLRSDRGIDRRDDLSPTHLNSNNITKRSVPQLRNGKGARGQRMLNAQLGGLMRNA